MGTEDGKLDLNSQDEDEVTEKYDPWEDDTFLEELDHRINSLESGEEQGVSWEEVKAKANKMLRSR